MLYTAWYFSNQEQFVHENAPKTKDGTSRGYRPAHKKHPMTMWIGSSLKNYLYACKIGIALTLEYTHRYGKIHTCAQHLIWLYENRPSHFEERRSETAYYSKEGIPECMPDAYKRESIVDAYQLYYMMDKMSFARYKNTPADYPRVHKSRREDSNLRPMLYESIALPAELRRHILFFKHFLLFLPN